MKMWIGGACQGQMGCAESHAPQIRWINGESCALDEIWICEGIYDFHKYIERWMKAGRETTGFARELVRKNPDIFLVTDEIGYGIVPVDDFLRRYREAAGRVCTELAAFSEEVYRVVCGIESKIKG